MSLAFCVVIAAMTKRAQIPFSAWLPAAMAAPTPVSALVHSSTLVTAGVYLLIRFRRVLTYEISLFLFYVSVLTIFISGLGANFEFDLKKIIALSTLSQLGLIMAILSLGFYKIAFFHLLTHAVFKALLFLCGGYIIHQYRNIQDIRILGSVGLVSPFVCSSINVANLALCGFPFIAGFYSKDLILEFMMESGTNYIGILLLMISCGFTVIYTVRLCLFIGIERTKKLRMVILGEVDKYILTSIMVLGVMGILGGSLLNWVIFRGGDCIVLRQYEKIMVLIFIVMGGLGGTYGKELALKSNKFFGDI